MLFSRSISFEVILGLIELARPVNCLIGFCSILAAAFVARGALAPLRDVMVAGLSGMFILAGGNAINDVLDVDIDRINRPMRPLPSGRISRRLAVMEAGFLFFVGVISGGTIGRLVGGIALLAVGLLILYSAWLKRTVLWGNLSVSALGGLAFLYGGLAAERMRAAWVPAILAFFFHFGREVLKDMEDVEGDRSAQANTFPVRFGLRRASLLAMLIYGVLVFLSPVPFLLGLYRWPYLVVVVLGVDGVVAYAIGSLWKDRSPRNLVRLSGLLKADMLIGLMAIVVGRG